MSKANGGDLRKGWGGVVGVQNLALSHEFLKSWLSGRPLASRQSRRVKSPPWSGINVTGQPGTTPMSVHRDHRDREIKRKGALVRIEDK